MRRFREISPVSFPDPDLKIGDENDFKYEHEEMACPFLLKANPPLAERLCRNRRRKEESVRAQRFSMRGF